MLYSFKVLVLSLSISIFSCFMLLRHYISEEILSFFFTALFLTGGGTGFLHHYNLKSRFEFLDLVGIFQLIFKCSEISLFKYFYFCFFSYLGPGSFLEMFRNI